MDIRLLLSRQETQLRRALDHHQQALNDGDHRCCYCGTPASIEEPHCTHGHQRCSTIIEGELLFATETRRLFAEKGEERSEG